jgi:hypothetical protein
VVYIVNNPVVSIHSFDVDVSPNSQAIIGRATGGQWRFFVTSDKLVLIEIEQKGTLGNFPNKQRYVSPNGGIEFQGSGPVEIYAKNQSGSDTAVVKTWNTDYLNGGLGSVYYTEDSLTTPASAAFGAMGTNGGYPQPFTNHCRIYVDAGTQTRIRATAPDGNVIFVSGAQPVDERLYIDLDTPQGYKFEIRESVSGSGVNYGLVWYRN